MRSRITERKEIPLNNFNVRAAIEGDVEKIKHLALVNHMFEPDEIGMFDEMLAGFFDGSLSDHYWIVADTEDDSAEIAAAAYFAPEPFSDRMWNLYFIATDPAQHGSGAGSTIIDHVEQQLRSAGDSLARTLIVDTSSMDDYEQARDFYRGRGFVQEATIREFYGPGDHKITFWKALND